MLTKHGKIPTFLRKSRWNEKYLQGVCTSPFYELAPRCSYSKIEPVRDIETNASKICHNLVFKCSHVFEKKAGQLDISPICPVRVDSVCQLDISPIWPA